MRSGSVALILTIIVLGFMMAVSTSYVTMVQTETRVQTSVDKSARAKDAAFAGVSYVIARLIATTTTFFSVKPSERLYVAYDATTTSKNNRFSGLTPADFTNVASSQWIYPDTTPLWDSLDSTDPSMSRETASSVAFRVTTYPATYPASITIDAGYYYVKSQGMYRDIDDGMTVTATYSAQILARLRIATLTYEVKLERYRAMEVENATPSAEFFSVRHVIYPPPPTVVP